MRNKGAAYCRYLLFVGHIEFVNGGVREFRNFFYSPDTARAWAEDTDNEKMVMAESGGAYQLWAEIVDRETMEVVEQGITTESGRWVWAREGDVLH